MNLLFTSWQDAWQLAGWTMILFLAGGTAVLIAAGTVRLLLRRGNANVRYVASLASFVLLATLPMLIAGSLLASRERQRPEELTTKDTKVTKEDLNANILLASPERQRWELATTDLAAEVTESTEEIGGNLEATASSTTFDFQSLLNRGVEYLPWVWIVGTPLTFLLLASGLLGAERLRRSCRLLADGPIHAACEELRIALKLSRKVGVAICDSISSPLVVGVVKPLILLPPAALTGWSPEHLEMVLVHELAHVRRWDNGVNLVQRIVESLLFFHPAVWIVSGWVRRDREDCCDAVVVRQTAKPQAYAELLLNLASSTRGLAASAAMAQHPLAGRIRRILKLQDEPMLVSRQALGFLASAVLACVLAVGFFAPSEAEEASLPRERGEVSRESERVADERSEETTNQDSATEDTESTEEESAELAKYTATYDVKGLGSKYSELLDHLRGTGEFKMTSDNDNQVVITARRSVHKRVAEYIDFLTRMHERPENTANNAQRPIIYAEKTEKLSDGVYRYSFLVPWVRAVDDPIRRATTEALIKSDLILSRAVKEMDLAEGTQPSTMNYLRKELSVHYSSDGHMFVALVGAKDGEAAVAAYAAPIINEYLKEHLTHLAKNQHDLATKDVKPAGEESVGRYATRDAGERTEASRQSERPEETTNLTNNTNQDLATEDTESTEEEVNAEGAKNPMFPTLEDQRAADLAYKLLGVELEKLNSEELERVKAKGYQGGLRVGANGMLAEHDILVGLHVWPTESLDQITEILTRKDLDQLSPLKFYVIRDNLSRPAGSPNEDRIVSGRIEVRLDALRTIQERRKEAALNQAVRSTLPLRAATKKHQLAALKYTQALDANEHVPGSVSEIDLKVLKAAVEAAKSEIESLSSQIGRPETGEAQQSSTVSRPSADNGPLNDGKTFDEGQAMQNQGRDATLQQLVALKKQVETELAFKEQVRDEGLVKDVEDRAMLDAEIAQLRDIVKQMGRRITSRTSQDKVTNATGNSPLYDGKTFDQWRQMWHTELKTEKRTECIKALAAFGRVGLGQEAADAVLDVAAEYDFSANSSGPVLEFKNAIQEVLTSGDGIAAEFWLPLYVDRLKQDPDKWSPMAPWVLRHLRSKNPEVLGLLISMAANHEFKSSVRRGALTSVIAQLEAGGDEAITVVRDALKSDDPLLVHMALSELAFSRFDQFPEQIELLFAEDNNVRRQAHNFLDRLTDSPHAALAIQKLFEVVDDPSRSEDHGRAYIAVCQIVAWYQQEAEFKKYIPEIHRRMSKVFVDGNTELYPYVINGLDRLNGASWQSFAQELKLSDEHAEQLRTAEEAANQINVQRSKGNY
jgi:beta-lactamase regulating signal transducer with metallopeptidase domain